MIDWDKPNKIGEYPRSSQLMRRMRRALDAKRLEVTITDWQNAAYADGFHVSEMNKFSNALYYKRVEKAEDEVAIRVSEGECNDGIMAHQRFCLRMASINGQATVLVKSSSLHRSEEQKMSPTH